MPTDGDEARAAAAEEGIECERWRQRRGTNVRPLGEVRLRFLDGDADLDLSKVVAFTQGAAPGAAAPNRLSSFTPGSLPRKQYDADRHAGIGSDRHVLPGEEAVSR